MRIAFYTPNYPGFNSEGGIGTYTRALAQGLGRSGHEVHVLTPGNFEAASEGPVRVHSTAIRYLPIVDRLVTGAGACWRVARSMRDLVKQHQIDIVEFPNWEGHGLLFQKWSRTPIVVRLHTSSRESQIIDQVPPSRGLRWDVHRERWLARGADALVTHSDVHRQMMAEEIGVPPDRIRLIPHGVEVSPDWKRPPRPPGPPTVVYLGRLEHRKGTLELLQAIPRVLQAVPEARFILIGADRAHCPGGRTHADYLEQEFPPAVRRQVTLAGRLPQEEVDRRLQTADLFVAPSRYESFGLIFIEAMRWGTPVVGTTAGGIPEVVEDEKSGVLVAPQSPEQLADAVTRLLLDAARRELLGAAGRKRVEEEFSVERMTQRAADLYEEVIQMKRGRTPAQALPREVPSGIR
jgi:glycosyltransferase involved in cell wall biosynthesis